MDSKTERLCTFVTFYIEMKEMKVYFYSLSVCALLIVCLWLLMLCLQVLHTDTFVAPREVQHGTLTAVYASAPGSLL